MQSPTPIPGPGTPQAHSQDYLVRVTADALRHIVFEHHCTVQDAGVLDGGGTPASCDCRAGITEWVGVVAGGARVSLGWDWLRLHDGQARPLTDCPPRSNLMVIDPRGYDLPLPDVVHHLWAAVRQIAWEDVVEEAEPELEACLETPCLLM